MAATIAASGQPKDPSGGAPDAVPDGPRGRPLRDLPAPSSREAVHGQELRPTLRRLFDARTAATLERIVRSSQLPAAPGTGAEDYPYRYAGLDRLLDTALRRPLDRSEAMAANDLGVLLTRTAAGPGSQGSGARLAFALFDRARAVSLCQPQLNVAFLLAAEPSPRFDDIVAETRRAQRVCRGDPTPLWVLGQFHSIRSGGQAAARTFRRLRKRLPRSPAGYAGAADDQLRRAYEIAVEQPFGARVRFRRALTSYRRALELDRDAGLLAGAARAEAGLRRYRKAAQLQARALEGRQGLAPLEARLVEYHERAHDFGRAASDARRFSRVHRFPSGRALFAASVGSSTSEELRAEDAYGPLSVGVERMVPATLEVAPSAPAVGAGAEVQDFSFVPRYRAVYGLTDHHRWCPEWSMRRDLILAGRAGMALRGLPARFTDVRPGPDGGDCGGGDFVRLLRAVAEFEAGRGDAALAWLEHNPDEFDARPATVQLHDARQNLWRFAGRLDRARSAARRWSAEEPEDPVAVDSRGEVEFLDRRYARAAALFGQAVRLSRRQAGRWSLREAESLVKQGTSLVLARRDSDGLALLALADEVASRARGLASKAEQEPSGEADFLSYHALLGAGNTLLRRKRFREAAERYEAAEAVESSKTFAFQPTETRGRPEVLFNNAALAYGRIGEHEKALRAAQRALRVDPANPIFLATHGRALSDLGRRRAAGVRFRRAVRTDPSYFPAWNELGVTLSEQGRHGAAADAFRRAVGARDGYATGWFNLGVALERDGPGHLLAAQGALGRAARLDPDLRERERDLIDDDRIYLTDLDLSKPLPPDWSFAESHRRAPAFAAGFALALLLGLRLSGTVLTRTGGNAAKWLEPVANALRRILRRRLLTTAALAAVVTVVALLAPLVRSGDADTTELVVVALGVVALIAIVMRARAVAAGVDGVALRARGWTPGIALGLVGGVAGLAWAPLPVVQTSRPSPAAHWAGPAASAAIGIALVVLGIWLEVPASRALGSAAMVMAASMLVPLRPLDGGQVGKGAAGLLANIALVGVAVLVLLGVGDSG